MLKVFQIQLKDSPVDYSSLHSMVVDYLSLELHIMQDSLVCAHNTIGQDGSFKMDHLM